ncbi:DnaA N-terminal domain-containing protein [Metabacillus herbersteinensis]|uniref:DnaA N-terminal domain-containing protein n=1 Tax=Metabacillus herbersteinensis TaxID=283816 RepID=A0ABV6GIR8_9BACI
MKRLNLKERDGELLYYREYKTEELLPVRQKRGENEESLHFKPIVQKKYFDEDIVKGWTLDNYGGPSPQIIEGSFTMIHNYFIDYWSFFLGPESVAIYVYLRRRCNMSEGRDYCWPSIEDICLRFGKSRNTVVKYLDILEQFGFIYRFYVENARKNNSKESPIFKVRMLIPFLPQDLVDKLPNDIQDDHDRDVSRWLSNPLLLGKEPIETIKYKEVYEDLEQKSVRSVVRKENGKRIQASVFEEEKKQINESEWTLWNLVLTQARNKMSKPSYETWLQSSYATMKQDEGHYILKIHLPNEFTKSWVESRYREFLIEILKNLDLPITQGVEMEKLNLEFYCPPEVQ